jgi:hypothetical protein
MRDMPDTITTPPFVVRRRGLGATTTTLYLGTLVFALMVLLTLVCVVVALVKGEPVRGPLEAVWLSWSGMPLIFAVGLPVLLLVGAISTRESPDEGDSDDVQLTIDDEGVYLGGDQARRLPWSQVQGICRVERRHDDGEGGESWEPHLIVMTCPETELDRVSRAWGPSCHWPGTYEILGRPLAFEALVTAVREHAPHIPVTDRGRVPE